MYFLPWGHELEIVAVRVRKCRDPSIVILSHPVRFGDNLGSKTLYPLELSHHITSLKVIHHAVRIWILPFDFVMGSKGQERLSNSKTVVSFHHPVRVLLKNLLVKIAEFPGILRENQ